MSIIISYNINGIRAGIRKGFHLWLEKINPEIICLQEIKASPNQFDVSVFSKLGYKCFWHPAKKPGYSGVAILSKKQPKHIEYGCGIQHIDYEGRVIRIDFDTFSVMSVYFPSGSSGVLRQSFKIKFLHEFYNYISELKSIHNNIIISGDYNICHKSRDIHNPIRNKNTSGFLPEERAWMTQFVENGFIDSFRYYNIESDQYSWWSYRANSRVKNLGWRIDYHMVSVSLQCNLRNAKILSEAFHSDHAPVLVELDI